MAIYFIQCGKNGPIKIGKTSNGIEERMAQLQTGCPYELRLLCVFTDVDYKESEIHKRFRHERVRGEWYRPSIRLFKFMAFFANPHIGGELPGL